MHKHNKYIFILLLLPLIFSSCGKNFLEFEQEGIIKPDSALRTKEDMKNLVISIYDVARSDAGFGGKTWYYGDIMADDLDGTLLTGDWASLYGHRTSIFISATNETWADPYRTIFRSNVVLENIANVPALNDTDKKWLEGQAKFFRGLSHFYIVRYYGQPIGGGKENEVQSGIPIRLFGNSQTLQQVVRSTTTEVYTQILADLDDAIRLLGEAPNYTAEKWYADVWAAKAMKAKVLFQMNRTADCYTLADEVIAHQGNTLESDLQLRMATPGTAAQPFNKEVIFGLYSKQSANSDLLEHYKKKSGAAGTANLLMSQEIATLATTDPKDKRGTTWIKAGNSGGRTVYYNQKWSFLPGREFIIPVIHVSELKLMRAECAAANGNTTQALADLNDIRTRAGLDIFSITELTTLLNEIRTQRRIEMMGEGNRLGEVKRIGAYYDNNLKLRVTSTSAGFPWNCPGMLIQIPNAEVAGNVNIKRNEEGGCN
jgi:starch-binding outer membrane protein, SusD/RagB family